MICSTKTIIITISISVISTIALILLIGWIYLKSRSSSGGGGQGDGTVWTGQWTTVPGNGKAGTDARASITIAPLSGNVQNPFIDANGGEITPPTYNDLRDTLTGQQKTDCKDDPYGENAPPFILKGSFYLGNLEHPLLPNNLKDTAMATDCYFRIINGKYQMWSPQLSSFIGANGGRSKGQMLFPPDSDTTKLWDITSDGADLGTHASNPNTYSIIEDNISPTQIPDTAFDTDEKKSWITYTVPTSRRNISRRSTIPSLLGYRGVSIP